MEKPRLLDMAKAIAPELARVYLLDSDELGDYPQPRDCFAWCRPNRRSIDGNLRQLLIERNEWRGPGPVVVMHSEEIEADASMPTMAHLATLFCHELAHCLPKASYPEDSEAPQELLAFQLKLAKVLAKAPEVRANQCPWGDDSTHGWRFIRRCCHLIWRANASRFIVPIHGFADGQYGLSPPRAYFISIGDEPIRMADATFEKIESTEPPADFIELWEADVDNWHRFNRR